MIARTNDKERQLRALREGRQKELASAANRVTDIPAGLRRIDDITTHDQPPPGPGHPTDETAAVRPLAEPDPVKREMAEQIVERKAMAKRQRKAKRPIKLVWKDGKAKGRLAHYECESNDGHNGPSGTYSLRINTASGSMLLEPVESPARVAGQAIEHETKLRDEGAPAYKPPANPTESDMRTKSKTKKAKAKSKARAKARTKVKAKTTSKAKTETGVRPGTKLEKVVQLLQRPNGCTNEDVLKATGWPSVSMPQQAKAAGITLVKEKTDGVTRYYDKATKAA
jgi:hypothetical protein